MFSVEIVGAMPGSAWDHPPWTTDDPELALKYALAVASMLRDDAAAPKTMKVTGPGYSGKTIELSEIFSRAYLFGDEKDRSII